jgi:hypothetical protein
VEEKATFETLCKGTFILILLSFQQVPRSARASPLLTLSLANKYYLLTTQLKVLELRLYQPSESMQGEILWISVFLEVEDVP